MYVGVKRATLVRLCVLQKVTMYSWPAELLSLLLLVRTGLPSGSALAISPDELIMCANTGEQNLQELVHTADVVATGRVLVSQEAVQGTLTVRINYYYAYKRDTKLQLSGFGCLKVKNVFNISPMAMLEAPALFFLVREPDDELALQCYNTGLGERSFRTLDYAEMIGQGEL